MDVKTAFLNGILEGMQCNNRVLVCKLNESLYGLKQSARCWFETFEKILIEMGFQNSPVDRCVYILNRGSISKNIHIILYVDDLVIATEDINRMNRIKSYLGNKFKMTNLKDTQLFLGIRILRDNNKISLDQTSYVNTVLYKLNIYDCKPNKTPLVEKLEFDKLDLDEYYDASCQNLPGCLMYLMVYTRPDLSFTINVWSRFVNKNNRTVWKYLKGVLRYLKGTFDSKLVYKRNSENNLEILTGYVDSDWPGDKITRISTTDYLFKLYDKCTISLNIEKQRSVADSSTAAEYMALYEATKEALWLKSLAKTVNINVNNVLIYEDNNGCIAMANNPSSYKLAKHTGIKYLYSREQIEKGNVRLKHVITEKQIAHMLT